MDKNSPPGSMERLKWLADQPDAVLLELIAQADGDAEARDTDAEVVLCKRYERMVKRKAWPSRDPAIDAADIRNSFYSLFIKTLRAGNIRVELEKNRKDIGGWVALVAHRTWVDTQPRHLFLSLSETRDDGSPLNEPAGPVAPGSSPEIRVRIIEILDCLLRCRAWEHEILTCLFVNFFQRKPGEFHLEHASSSLFTVHRSARVELITIRYLDSVRKGMDSFLKRLECPLSEKLLKERPGLKPATIGDSRIEQYYLPDSDFAAQITQWWNRVVAFVLESLHKKAYKKAGASV